MDFLPVQLYNEDGTFNVDEIEKFSRTANIAAWGYSYSVVSIIGPQSSGKSTLLNHLFQTKFLEMDDRMGRSKTTKGIWLGKAHGTATLAIDIEGTDGIERGEDDALYERQSALFALAISDVVIVNMWCHDIGREQGGSRPLLKNLFQVMLQMLSPRKRLLLFVLRDKTRTPLEILEAKLREGIQEIYDSVHKPDAHKDTPLSKFFIIQVTALSSYEEKKVEFEKQVTGLRLKIHNSTISGVLEHQQERVPASEFLYSAHQIWTTIRGNRDLDLPSLRVMVSTVRCEEIAKELLSRLEHNQDLNKMEEIASFGQVSSFKTESNAIVKIYLSEYNEKTLYFDEIVKASKRQLLEDKVMHHLEPAYQSILENLLSKRFDNFRKALARARESGQEFSVAAEHCREQFLSKFEEECKEAAIEQAHWDSSKFLDKLRYKINSNIALLRTQSIEAELAASRKASSEQRVVNHTRTSMIKTAKLGVVLFLGSLGVGLPIEM